MAVKAVIFDFWGTLVGTGTWSPLRQSQNILHVPSQFSDFVGKFERAFMTKSFQDQQKAFAAVCEAFGMKPYGPIIDRLIGVWNQNRLLAKPYPETAEVLQALKDKGIKVGILSNSDCFAADLLERFSIVPDATSLSFETGKLKIDEGTVQELLNQLGVSAEETILVGDTVESDMHAAELAGVRGILVDRKASREYASKINDLKELLPLIE